MGNPTAEAKGKEETHIRRILNLADRISEHSLSIRSSARALEGNEDEKEISEQPTASGHLHELEDKLSNTFRFLDDAYKTLQVVV